VVKKWKTLAVKTVYATPWLTLRLETCELAPGKVVTDYHVTHYGPVVFVVAVTPDQNVVLVQQYRQGIKEITTELPAGGVEPNEDVVAAGRRELLEETGYSAEHFEHLCTLAPNPSGSDNYHCFLLAHDARQRQVPQGCADTETTEVLTVSIQHAYAMAVRGEISSTSSVAGIYAALTHLGVLQLRI